MKAILKSIRPQHVRNILNGDKKLEISGTAPKEWKDYLSGKTNQKPGPREVYIYCTKSTNGEVLDDNYNHFTGKRYWFFTKCWTPNENNGKVVAKFTLNKVEKIIDKETKEKNHYSFGTETLQPDELEQMSCLNIQELCKYIGKGARWTYGDYGYAWHIDDLEIFDKPKEISEFYNRLAPNFEHLVKYFEKRGEKYTRDDYDRYCEKVGYKLTRAPQSWCYIGMEN